MVRAMAVNISQAVLLAGGLGTRLRPFTEHSPKPLYPFEGKPFIGYLVEQIRDFGIRNILILLGYLPEKIMDYLGDGTDFGVHIEYDITPIEYETGARLRAASSKIRDVFLMMYCDNYCPIDFPQLLRDFNAQDAFIQLSAYTNYDDYSKSNLRIAKNGLIEAYDKKRSAPHLQGVDIGYAIMRKSVFQLLPEENRNFEATVYPQIVAKHQMCATATEHRYYSVGSWERIALTKQFFSPKKYIFLDRDGTLNVRPPQAEYVEKVEDFLWLPHAKEALRQLYNAGYTIFLVSNQPGIARGRLTEDTLTAIHEKMARDLSDIGAYIEKIYYCPHDWEEGCACRKPKPGMFYQAQKEYSIDLTRCVMIGDDERDMTAAQAAGCKGILVGDTYSLQDAVNDILVNRLGGVR